MGELGRRVAELEMAVTALAEFVWSDAAREAAAEARKGSASGSPTAAHDAAAAAMRGKADEHEAAGRHDQAAALRDAASKTEGRQDSKADFTHSDLAQNATSERRANGDDSGRAQGAREATHIFDQHAPAL